MKPLPEQTEEYKLLIRQSATLAEIMLDVRADLDYAVGMFRIQLQLEALKRCDGNRSKAAEMLHMHRNTFTRNLPVEQRKCQERFATAGRIPPSRASRGGRIRQQLLGYRVGSV